VVVELHEEEDWFGLQQVDDFLDNLASEFAASRRRIAERAQGYTHQMNALVREIGDRGRHDRGHKPRPTRIAEGLPPTQPSPAPSVESDRTVAATKVAIADTEAAAASAAPNVISPVEAG
jgi:hypothetical protein